MKKNIIKIIIFVILLLGCLSYLTKLSERKESAIKMKSFFEEKENFDVLFLGTSHVINGIFPMELWNEYGIVSFNLANSGSVPATTYWTMKLAFDYTKPKLALIDCYALNREYKTSTKSYLHNTLDAFPISINKIKAIYDLHDDPNIGEMFDDRTETRLLWNFTVFHSRWDQLTQKDFDIKYSKEKGSSMLTTLGNPSNKNRYNTNSKLENETVSVKYLKKMIEECKKNNIEVLLTYLPIIPDETDKKDANYVYDLAKKYNINYINFLDTHIINDNYDYSDNGNHVNVSGGRKITKYIGQYIIENYDIKDRRNDKKYSHWNKYYKEYINYKKQYYEKQETLEKYLVMASGDNYNQIIEILDENLYKNKDRIKNLESVGIDIDKINKNTDLILIKDGVVEYIDNFHISNKIVETSFGKIKYIEKDGSYLIKIEDDEIFNITGSQNENVSLRIGILDKNTNKIVTSSKFYYTDSNFTQN